MSEVLIFDNHEELFDSVFEVLKASVAENPELHLGLAAGNTPIPLYQRMVKSPEDFQALKYFALDEYLGLGCNDSQSFCSFFKRVLFDPLKIQKEQNYLIEGDTLDAKAEAKRYEALIDKEGIDIQLLGIGINGHIGFNEPGVSLDSATHIVDLSKETLKANQQALFGAPVKITKAITQGVSTILKSEMILMIATGESKALAVREALQGEISQDCPASALQDHDNVMWFLDERAASRLSY